MHISNEHMHGAHIAVTSLHFDAVATVVCLRTMGDEDGPAAPDCCWCNNCAAIAGGIVPRFTWCSLLLLLLLLLFVLLLVMVLMWLLLLTSDDESSLFVLDARKIGNDCTADSKFDIDEPEITHKIYGKIKMCYVYDFKRDKMMDF